MKILQINVTYNKGSTGKIVFALHNELLKDNFQSVVCYGRESGKDKLADKNNIYKISSEFILKMQSFTSRLTGYVYSGCIISTAKLIKIIKNETPDLVHLHCLNGYFVNIYKLLAFLKTNNIKTVVTLHAEFMYTAGCSYSYECIKWKTGCCENNEKCPQFNLNRPKSFIFNRCNKEWKMMQSAFKDYQGLTICPVSDWVKNKAVQSPFFKDREIITVQNGIDTSVFKFNEAIKSAKLKEKLGIKDEKIILHVTANFNQTIKGGKYVIDIAAKYQGSNVKIIIVGFNGDKKALPSNVIPISYIASQIALAEYYSIADVTLLTSKKETFSMVCAESLCCGTPIVGFNSGAPEMIAMKEQSEFVEYGNIYKLKKTLDLWLDKTYDKSKISKAAADIYNQKAMAQKYKEIYKGMTLC